MRPADAGRLVLLGAIWGSSFVFIKLALDGYSGIQIVAGRLAAGAGVLLLLVRLRGEALPRGRTVWRDLAFMAVVANIVPFVLINVGTERISSSLASILNSSTPLFTALFAAALVPGERLGLMRAAGIITGFAGVAVILGGGGGGSVGGQIAIVAASVSYGVGFVYARMRLVALENTRLTIAAAQLSLATVLFLPIAVIDGVVNTPAWGWGPTVGVVWIGALGAGIAYLLYYRLITDVGPTTASFATYLIPIFGTLLGWLVRDETLGFGALAGAALVILGITVAERARAKTAADAALEARAVS